MPAAGQSATTDAGDKLTEWKVRMGRSARMYGSIGPCGLDALNLKILVKRDHRLVTPRKLLAGPRIREDAGVVLVSQQAVNELLDDWPTRSRPKAPPAQCVGE